MSNEFVNAVISATSPGHAGANVLLNLSAIQPNGSLLTSKIKAQKIGEDIEKSFFIDYRFIEINNEKDRKTVNGVITKLLEKKPIQKNSDTKCTARVPQLSFK